MTEDAIERLLVVASLAVKVECRPLRRDGSAAATYESSGATLARRIRAKPEAVSEDGDVAPAPTEASPGAAYFWNIAIRSGAARRTLYTAWVQESPEDIERIVHARREREQLRASLSHHERKKAPWGRL